jgi:hypothetical protein
VRELGIALIAASLLVAGIQGCPQAPDVPPGPPPPVTPDAPDAPEDPPGLSFRGLAGGPTFQADMALLRDLTAEMAAVVDWDGSGKPPPEGPGTASITNAGHLERLRVLAMRGHARGVTVGERHPRVREAIGRYLDAQVGTSGRPLTAESRATHVAALLAISQAAAAAATSSEVADGRPAAE